MALPRSARPRRALLLDVLEWLLIVVLVATTTVLATRWVARASAQRQERARLARWLDERRTEPRAGRPRLPRDGARSARAESARADTAGAAPAHADATSRGSRTAPAARPDVPLGTISIPRLGLEAAIRDGADDATLDVAVGRIPGTSRSALQGNIGLAAHRDTLFRPLRHVRTGDVVRLRTPDGTYDYTVSDITVVEPEDVWVLDPTDRPSVTLVTCYPFTFIGSAPQRFIVRAERRDAP